MYDLLVFIIEKICKKRMLKKGFLFIYEIIFFCLDAFNYLAEL